MSRLFADAEADEAADGEGVTEFLAGCFEKRGDRGVGILHETLLEQALLGVEFLELTGMIFSIISAGLPSFASCLRNTSLSASTSSAGMSSALSPAGAVAAMWRVRSLTRFLNPSPLVVSALSQPTSTSTPTLPPRWM